MIVSDSVFIHSPPLIILIEIDTREFSPLIQNLEQSNIFRSETISYVEASLSGKADPELSQISTNPLITCFKPIAEAVLGVYDSRKRPCYSASVIWLT